MEFVSDTKAKLNPQVPPFGPLPVAVIGAGRMGRLHCRFYSQMPQVKLVGVYDSKPEAALAAADEFNTKAFTNLDEMLKQTAAATIAVPTTAHPDVAKQ